MKYIASIFFLTFLLNTTSGASLINSSFNAKKGRCAITYKLESWRRLGDNIITYIKAKIFACCYDIPLLCKAFPYSDQFAFSTKEVFLTDKDEKNYEKIVPIDRISDFEEALKTGQSILFECHFLTESPWLYKYSRENPNFEKEIKMMLSPIIPLEQLAKPESVVTVAVHVRKGGGFDMPLASLQEYDITQEHIEGIYLKKKSMGDCCTDLWPLKWPIGPIFIEEVKKLQHKKTSFSDFVWPIKFPPDQYYIDQIKELIKIIPDRNLLIYIFTDDPNPEQIMHRYSKALQEYPRLIFSYRSTGNHHTKNVLQDLFSLASCDCLISANSSFAQVAQLVGNHSIIMIPLHAITFPDKIFMNKIAVFGMNNAYDLKNRTMFYNEISHKLK